jgi:hypothetical protein
LGNFKSAITNAKFKGLERASIIFEGRAKQEAPSKTFNLRKSIVHKTQSDGNKAVVKTELDYSVHQEFGTGIYGIKRRPITPKRGKFLKFEVNGKTVFARSVKGVKGKFFMKKGSEELSRRTNEINSVIYDELKKGLQ